MLKQLLGEGANAINISGKFVNLMFFSSVVAKVTCLRMRKLHNLVVYKDSTCHNGLLDHNYITNPLSIYK